MVTFIAIISAAIFLSVAGLALFFREKGKWERVGSIKVQKTRKSLISNKKITEDGYVVIEKNKNNGKVRGYFESAFGETKSIGEEHAKEIYRNIKNES